MAGVRAACPLRTQQLSGRQPAVGAAVGSLRWLRRRAPDGSAPRLRCGPTTAATVSQHMELLASRRLRRNRQQHRGGQLSGIEHEGHSRGDLRAPHELHANGRMGKQAVSEGAGAACAGC